MKTYPVQPLNFLFERIAQFFVQRFELFDFTEPLAVRRVDDDQTFFSDALTAG